MAEQSTERLITDDPTLPGEHMAAQITSLVEYGPIEIRTFVPDIPGVEYQKPYRHESDQRPVARIGHSALSVLVDDAGVRVAVQAEASNTPYILTPEQIDDVWIDHPHGEHMPLHGEDMMTVGLTTREGISVLRWPDHVIEHGWRDRIETDTHPDCPGISVIRTFRADDENIMGTGERKVPSLDEAKEKDSEPGVFYITRVDDDTYVVTSRIGYEVTRPVTVRRPRHPGNEPLRHVEMLDMAQGTSDEELLDNHLKRFRQVSRKYHKTPQWPMTPFERDSIFLYMVSD